MGDQTTPLLLASVSTSAATLTATFSPVGRVTTSSALTGVTFSDGAGGGISILAHTAGMVGEREGGAHPSGNGGSLSLSRLCPPARLSTPHTSHLLSLPAAQSLTWPRGRS